MGNILPYLNPDSRGAVVLARALMMVGLVTVLTLGLAAVAILAIEYLPARWRAFLRSSGKG